ncbi:helix-turn-helix domain-containing protein [Streptomyces sp. NBC_01635]|uniref:helix-turn-helix domain-containing protein n=1 Tax=Streptomyces sp. NBC_01635 TaxID=2975904 RepID=UPI00386617CB|nr:helix-turn-helix domain-containing protein [Streptomyces sp. NBC_01635]
MSTEEILALPASVDLVTAGRALNIGRTLTYDLARRGELPVPTLRLGNALRVRRSDILAALAIEDSQARTALAAA